MTDQNNLHLLWAQNGELDSAGYNAKFLQGWVAEAPSHQIHNSYQRAISENLLHFAERSGFNWNEFIPYVNEAEAYSTAANAWYTLLPGFTSTNEEPSVTPLRWRVGRAGNTAGSVNVSFLVADATSDNHAVNRSYGDIRYALRAGSASQRFRVDAPVTGATGDDYALPRSTLDTRYAAIKQSSWGLVVNTNGTNSRPAGWGVVSSGTGLWDITHPDLGTDRAICYNADTASDGYHFNTTNKIATGFRVEIRRNGVLSNVRFNCIVSGTN